MTAPTPSRSCHSPKAPKAAPIDLSIRSITSTAANLATRERAPQGVVSALAAAALDRLAQPAARVGDRASVAADVDAAAHLAGTAQLEPRRHLLLRLEAAHQAAANRVGVGLSLQRVAALLERAKRCVEVVEAFV